MVSALDSRSGAPGSSPGRGTAFCSWTRHIFLIVHLSTQVYIWVPANLPLGVTLRWTSIVLCFVVDVVVVVFAVVFLVLIIAVITLAISADKHQPLLLCG